jgi:hypothetical protein
MNERPYIPAIAAVALVLISGLACSVSGELDVDGPFGGASTSEPESSEALTETARPDTGATPEPTMLPPTEEEAVEGSNSATDPAPTEEPTDATEPPPDSTREGTESTDPTAAPDTAQIEDPLALADIPELKSSSLDPTGGGMGHLSSFRQRMVMDFTAEETGYESVLRYESDVVPPESAVHIVVSAEGPAAQELPASQAEAIWIGDRLWIKAGRQPWIPVPESVAAVRFDEQTFAVGDFLPYILHFDRVGEETVNGIPSVRYSYDVDDAVTEYGQFSGTGDVFVAKDGGYVVRYTADGHATFEEYLEGSAGAFKLVYDTYDVGAAIDISPPRR